MAEADPFQKRFGMFRSAAPPGCKSDLVKSAKMRKQGQSLENKRDLAVLGGDQHFTCARPLEIDGFDFQGLLGAECHSCTCLHRSIGSPLRLYVLVIFRFASVARLKRRA